MPFVNTNWSNHTEPIPYQINYTCVHCHKEVKENRELTSGRYWVSEKPDTEELPEIMKLMQSSAERLSALVNSSSQNAADYEENLKRCTIYGSDQCPHCGKKQGWGMTSRGGALSGLFIAIGILALIAGIGLPLMDILENGLEYWGINSLFLLGGIAIFAVSLVAGRLLNKQHEKKRAKTVCQMIKPENVPVITLLSTDQTASSADQ